VSLDGESGWRSSFRPTSLPSTTTHSHHSLSQGKKAAVDALFGPLVMPTLNVALDPAARSSVRFAALEALARGVGRSKSAASAIVHADKAAWRALAGSTLPTAGDYGVQVNTTYLMYAALKAGVAGALDAGALGDREAEAALRGLARRTASSFDWDTEARALLTAYNGRRGNSASVISVKATYVVAKGPGGVAAAEDEDAAWVDFGVPGAAGGSRKAGPHANVFLAVHGEASDEIMLTIPYGEREREYGVCVGALASLISQNHSSIQPLQNNHNTQTPAPCGPT